MCIYPTLEIIKINWNYYQIPEINFVIIFLICNLILHFPFLSLLLYIYKILFYSINVNIILFNL